MKLRHLAAALTLGAVVLGGTATAIAQDAPAILSRAAASNAHAHARQCTKATARLSKINDREAKVGARSTKLQAKLATAQQANNTDAVNGIQFRIDRLQKVDAQLKDATNAITSECPAS